MRSTKLSLRAGLLPLALASCANSANSGPESSGQGVAQQATTGASHVTIDNDKSLFVTEAPTLADFPLEAVLSRILSTGHSSQSPLNVYRQMVDTLNDKKHAVTDGPHCDDDTVDGKPAINGFPEQFCPRQEGVLATTDPFSSRGVGDDGGPENRDAYVPVAVVNRFDLAPSTGDNCGQYRVVFGKVSGQQPLPNGTCVGSNANRMMIIFEAVLPNPDLGAGIEGCRPVAQFWANLSSEDATTRAAHLKSFFFEGLTGTSAQTTFAPVIQAEHYGIGGGTNTGQIRANMFMNFVLGQPWELREFRLSQGCEGASCTLTVNNTAPQTNPWGPLFSGTDPGSVAFQKKFLAQIPSLAATSLTAITMTTPFSDDGPQSDEQEPTNNDYFAEAKSNTSFLKEISSALTGLPSPASTLTAENILDRATTQSCAGCHEIAVGRHLGEGLVWPSSNDIFTSPPTPNFTQVDECSNESPALTKVFLPARAKILESFLADGGSIQAVEGRTVGGSTVGSAN